MVRRTHLKGSCMDTHLLQSKFGLMGARLKMTHQARLLPQHAQFTVDVRSDRKGEYFDIRFVDGQVDLKVLDVRPEMRHLLLMAPAGKFLCGHDERHWFSAAVPGNASNVKTALVALKPVVVRMEEEGKGIRTKDR